jgi:N-acetylglucosamine-6-phosphate deacetylase
MLYSGTALLLTACRYDTLRPVEIEIAGGRIARISPAGQQSDLHLVAPGLVDLQINGFGGTEFNDRELTIEKVRQVALSQDQFGVTAFLATCTTDSHDVLRHALATIAAAIRELPEVACRVPGIHLEGPFISPEDGPRGAHPRRTSSAAWPPAACSWRLATPRQPATKSRRRLMRGRG